jgi:YVTN family beta-propeller protein
VRLVTHDRPARLAPWTLLLVSLPFAFGAGDGGKAVPQTYRSPIALALSTDGSRLLVANQGSGSVALVDPKAGKVLAEIVTGDKPAGVALSKDGKRGVVSHWYGYDVAVLEVMPEGVKVAARVDVGPEPRGVVLANDGKTAFVAVGASNEVVRVDLDKHLVTGRLTVGREPRGLAITTDGKTLVVGNTRSESVSVIDVAGWKVARTLPLEPSASNLRQVALDPSGKTAYVANMRNRGMATTQGNIDSGWVLGQRLAKVALDGGSPFETISLDPKGKAFADVHGVAIRPDGKAIAMSSGGTHELILLREEAKPLPWRSNGSRDLIPGELNGRDGRFRRVDVGGRPTELAFSPDGATVYVANYLGDSIQAVDFDSGKVAQTIDLGGPKEISLVRRGELIFHDATRSSNQWYSCNTCHSDGHTSGLDFDTMNDGWYDLTANHLYSHKKVPTLRRVAKTGPWTWHGWQKSLDDAMIESFTKSMQGKRPTAEDVQAVVAFIGTLDYPRNPNRNLDGGLTPAAKRGEAIFRSSKAACSRCHGGGELTDGKVHVVGLEERGDVYDGYNPPSLRGTYDKDPYLHDGRAKTLKDVLSGPHNPVEFPGGAALSDAERDDLIAYLKSL